MSKFDYTYTRKVRAAQWTGENLQEMQELLEGVVESPDYVYAEYIEALFGYGGYNMLKFEAWGDDQEVDPGQWVVVYDQGDDGEVMPEELFDSMYRKS
jgi:hypothetical protein